jgi:hypothetical protein
VKPAVPEPPPTTEDKGKDKINDDVPGTQKPHSIRKKCPDKLIMALDLRPSIRIRGIRHLTKLHGGKHQGIKLLNIKLLGLVHLGSRHLSISGLSSDLYQQIIVAPQRPNPSSLEGLRRWKKINTSVSHLSGCRA